MANGDLNKNVAYTGRYDIIRRALHPFPILGHNDLCKVKNSIVACRLCHGEKLVSIANTERNQVTTHYCPHCKGTGVMHTIDD